MKLFEIFGTDLVREFKNTVDDKQLKKFCKRDNCGYAVESFLDWLKVSKNIHGFKVQGYFYADKPSVTLKDFTKEEISKMIKDGYDANDIHERLRFVDDNNLIEELKKIPHYWAEINDKIYDIVGKEQFIDSGLSDDLNDFRYHVIRKIQW